MSKVLPTDCTLLPLTREALNYAGYIGGSNWDWGYSTTLDGAGNAHITGTDLPSRLSNA